MTAAEPRGVGLAEFLLARIAEDEGAARIHDGESPTWRGGRWPESLVVPPGTRVWRTFDPARVLAECAAKRRIVEFHKSWPVLVEQRPTFEADPIRTGVSAVTMRMSQQIAWLTEQEYRTRFGTEPPTAPMLRALASVYASHPDYCPEWA